jgi:hypothetical protein
MQLQSRITLSWRVSCLAGAVPAVTFAEPVRSCAMHNRFLRGAIPLGLSISLLSANPVAAQDRPVSEGLRRSAFGISFTGLVPRGELAANVNFAGGAGGSSLFRVWRVGIAAILADLG